MRPVDRHRESAEGLQVGAGVITASDTRTEGDDASGRLIRELLEEGGVRVVAYDIVRDDIRSIQTLIRRMVRHEDIDMVIVNGGTGISPRDVTPEAVAPLLEKRIDGLAELFRHLSFMEVGVAGVLSRAIAGTTREGKLIFAVPGSPGAARLAVERVILPEVRHMVRLARGVGHHPP